MGWDRLASGSAMMLVLLVGCASSNSASPDPYAKNPARRDPRASPLTKRNGPADDPVKVATEFKALKRPIIDRYIRYSGQTLAEARQGENPNYTHIVLTDEACAFVNRHTFDELAIGLGPCIRDPYWNGDAVAVLAVATTSVMRLGKWLARNNYHSPDDPGGWPGRIKKYPGDIPWFVTYYGATVKLNLYDGTVTDLTAEEIQDDRRRMEVARKRGLLR
jgi:hypothetical protein